jgi:hypothetical protein
MRVWIDAVLFEFARVTWEEWVVTLVGGCALAWLAAWYRHAK